MTTTPDDILLRLQTRLEQPLPGRAAQSIFEPELAYGRHFGPPPHDARRAAVLVFIYPHSSILHGNAWHIALTKRRDDLPVHPGQVSLPGGYVEPEETTKGAALRELEEELGVPAESITLLGNLSPLYIFGTNFYVIPWIAGIEQRPAFVPNAAEVGALFEVPLDYLLDPANRGVHPRLIRGIRQTVPHFDWQLEPDADSPSEMPIEKVWGATAMILSEFLAVWLDATATSKQERR